MKIKEAYHYLSVLSDYETQIKQNMSNVSLLKKTTEIHKKSDVISSESDETKEIVNKDFDYTFDDLVKLWATIIDEKQKIYSMIETKKKEMNLPESIYTINKSMRDLIMTLRYCNKLSKKEVTRRKENGFIKSSDGVGTYSYDVEVVSEPVYDSKYFLDRLDTYSKLADNNSNTIDTFDTNVDIEYVPRWSEHSLLEDLLK